jgi:ankyrin repeat protein
MLPWWAWLLGAVGAIGIALAAWHFGSLIRPVNRMIRAASKGRTDKVRRYLESGIGVDAPGSLGSTALFAAVGYKRTGTALFLLERGANPNQAALGLPVLTIAVGDRLVEVVAELLSRGADPNVPGWRLSGPPLHTAIDRDSPEMVRLLAGAGADLEAVAHTGFTPLLSALGRTGGGRRGAPDREAAFEVVRALLEAGASPSNPGRTAFTPMLLAIQMGSREAVETLLDHGASPLDRSPDGILPHTFAEAAGQPELARLLRERAGPALAEFDLEGEWQGGGR